MAVAVPHLAPEPDHPDRARLRTIGERVRRRLAANKAVQLLPCDEAEAWAMANFLDLEECAALIAMIDAVAVPSRTYSASEDPDFRTSSSAPLHPREALVRKVQRRIDRLLGLDCSHGEALQGQRYTAGQQFKPHTDWFPQGTPGWRIEQDNGGQRSITAMVYLNSVDHGGETDFPRLDMAVAPRRGTLLAWNNADREGVPNPFTIHAGNPLGAGSKYVVTRWYRCGPTRQLA
ncbi:prolyl hydroxylase family protein [Tsuneonella sp. HG222]